MFRKKITNILDHCNATNTERKSKPSHNNPVTVSQHDNKVQCSGSPGTKRQLSTDSAVPEASSPKRVKVNESVTRDTAKRSLLVSYDLELCDGSFASEIFQLGAVCKQASIAKNILPEGNIDWGVTRYATNITVKNRHLFDVKTKEYLPSESAGDALKEFLNWLNAIKIEGDYSEIVLIAQGDMDMPALINNMARANLMTELLKVVDRFADSLKYFQANFKTWDKFSVSLVWARVFPNKPAFKAHSAIEDSQALFDILIELNIDKEDELETRIKEHSHSAQECILIAKKRIAKTLAKAKKETTAAEQLYKKVFSHNIVNKVVHE